MTDRFLNDAAVNSIGVGSVDGAADYFPVHDASASELKKILASDVLKRLLSTSDVSWMTALANIAAVSSVNDKFIVWDADATALKTLAATEILDRLLTTLDIAALGSMTTVESIDMTNDRLLVWDASATAFVALTASQVIGKLWQGPKVAITSSPQSPAASTSGTLYHNTGSTVAITVNLPAATAGLRFSFVRVAAYSITLDGNGSETINGELTYSIDAPGRVDIECFTAGAWLVTQHSGKAVTGILNVRDYGLATTAADNTAAWNALVAIVNASGGGKTIEFPAGTFTFTPNASLTAITANEVHIRGAGTASTTITFNPTANATCLSWDLTQLRGSLTDIRINSSDTTYSKVGVYISDASQFRVHNVNVQDFFGANSEGIRYEGREFGSIEDCQIVATVPIRLRKNPNVSGLDADFLSIRKCHLIGHSSAPSSLTDATILIDDAVQLQNVEVCDVAMALNQYGVYWVQATQSASQSLAVKFDNVRTEQMRSGGQSFRLAPHVNTPLAQVNFINCVTDEFRQGYYLKDCWHITKIGGQDAQSGTVLEQAGTCLSMHFIGHRGVATGTVTTSGLYQRVRHSPYSAFVLPAFGVWTHSSAPSDGWRGSATFATAATKAVTFATAEPDTSYFVSIAGSANETFWVTSKTVNGFTLNSSNASSTATVDWAISR